MQMLTSECRTSTQKLDQHLKPDVLEPSENGAASSMAMRRAKEARFSSCPWGHIEASREEAAAGFKGTESGHLHQFHNTMASTHRGHTWHGIETGLGGRDTADLGLQVPEGGWQVL